MTRRSFLAALAAVLTMPRPRSGSLGRLGTWFGPFPETEMSTVLHGDRVVLSGHEMKRWMQATVAQAIENNRTGNATMASEANK